ncbi:protein kinase [Myxococcota bacterium]|nr:protein kinase [Myxococcota bacterium]
MTTIRNDPASVRVPEPGELISGRYVVEGILGQGSSGVVLAVREGARPLALKLFTRQGDEVLARFHRERSALNTLRHPAVVIATDAGQHETTPFLVMERLSGRPLRRVHDALPPWTGGPASPELVAVVRPVLRLLEVLDALHQRGWIHRDLSPSNVLVEDDGRVRLLDLGLAAPFGVHGRAGTVGYMAPEQATGRELGPPADLFSCGALLYQLLTSQLPWGRLRGVELLRQQLTQAPSPPHLREPGVPPALSAAVLALLRVDPADRPQRATDAKALLEQALAGEPQESGARELGGAFVGRHRELAAIGALLDEAARGGRVPPLVFVGEAGTGKSRLIEEALSMALLRGFSLLRMPRGATPLEQLSRCVLVTPGGVTPSPERRAEDEPCPHQLIAELLQRLGPAAPCLVVNDDYGEQDHLGPPLLQAALPAGVGLIATARREPDLPEDGFDLQLLGALSETDLRALLGDDDGVLARLLADASDGNPLLATHTLRGWLQSGRVRRRESGWEMAPGLVMEVELGADLPIPERLAASLRDRAQSTTPEGRRLLDALAALGGSGTRGMLRSTGALEPGRVDETVDALVGAGLVVAAPGPPAFLRLFHRRAAEVLVQALRPSTVRRWASAALEADPELPDAYRLRLLHRAGRIYEAARIELALAERLEAEGDRLGARSLYLAAAGALAGEERAAAEAGAARCR